MEFEEKKKKHEIANPLVSVIIPSYNHELYIRKCIESIYIQDYDNLEVIIIDDGSIDRSRNILKDLQIQYGFTLVLQENIGVASTLNKAIETYVNGKYYTFCASDDYWLKGKISKQVKYLEEHQKTAMCFGKSIVINECDIENPKYTSVINKNLRGGTIFNDIILGNFHPPVNYMLRTEIIKKLGLYNPHIHTEDFYMNLKISSKFQIGYIDDFLSYYRIINAEKKRLNLKTFNSKLECINEYSGHVLYNKAKRKIYYSAFIEYSSYIAYKLFSAKCFLQSRTEIFQMNSLKGILKFVLLWK